MQRTGDSSFIDPLDYPYSTAVGVPRRFGMGGLMILVTMCALLFAGLSLLDLDKKPAVFAVIAILFVAVAVGQILLFEGNKPRQASMWVGGCLLPIMILPIGIYHHAEIGGILIGSICLIPAGIISGYLAGVLSAGVFFVISRFRKDPEAVPTIELEPFTEEDIDTLLDWVEGPRLLQLWAGPLFSEPLDKEQLQGHLQRAGGEEPNLLIFKAVCRETRRTLGHVELSRIDRALQCGRLSRALVAPAEPHRDTLSRKLIRAILEKAFDELELHRIEVLAFDFNTRAIACYQDAGFLREGLIRGLYRYRGVYASVSQMAILDYEWRWQQR